MLLPSYYVNPVSIYSINPFLAEIVGKLPYCLGAWGITFKSRTVSIYRISLFLAEIVGKLSYNSRTLGKVSNSLTIILVVVAVKLFGELFWW